MIKDRIKKKMNYDDFLTYISITIIYEYFFIFRSLLVQDVSIEKNILTVINFMII